MCVRVRVCVRARVCVCVCVCVKWEKEHLDPLMPNFTYLDFKDYLIGALGDLFDPGFIWPHHIYYVRFFFFFPFLTASFCPTTSRAVNLRKYSYSAFCHFRKYAVKVQRSLAPLSRFRGSHILTAHEQECCRNLHCVNHIPGIHDNGPRDHELWHRTLTAYCQAFSIIYFWRLVLMKINCNFYPFHPTPSIPRENLGSL